MKGRRVNNPKFLGDFSSVTEAIPHLIDEVLDSLQTCFPQTSQSDDFAIMFWIGDFPVTLQAYLNYHEFKSGNTSSLFIDCGSRKRVMLSQQFYYDPYDLDRSELDVTQAVESIMRRFDVSKERLRNHFIINKELTLKELENW
jgi:hypothetical protein